MVGLRQIKKVQTLEDLEGLGIGEPVVEIGHRGGGVGLYSSNVANHFDININYLPRNFGAGCNYLGGGIRGSIFPSTFAPKIKGRKADLLSALADACVRVYENIENENRMNKDIF